MQNTKWTLQDAPNLKGKIIIVTGGNSGLGFEAVKAFASKNAEVILACRSIEKGDKAKMELQGQLQEANINVMPLDLSDLSSVRQFVDEFKSRYNHLDVLLNNAGIMMTPYQLTKDGFESQFGTNHLGHFALTGLLLDLIRRTKDSRVVNVSSNAHKWGNMDFENLMFEKGKSYTPTKAYGRSKLANLLFTYELQRKFENHKITAMSAAAHPGGSITNLANHLTNKIWFKILMPFAGLFTHSPAAGALPEIRAAIDPGVLPAEYYGPNGFNEMKGDPVLVHSNRASHSQEDAAKLWDASEKLTGISFNFA